MEEILEEEVVQETGNIMEKVQLKKGDKVTFDRYPTKDEWAGIGEVPILLGAGNIYTVKSSNYDRINPYVYIEGFEGAYPAACFSKVEHRVLSIHDVSTGDKLKVERHPTTSDWVKCGVCEVPIEFGIGSICTIEAIDVQHYTVKLKECVFWYPVSIFSKVSKAEEQLPLLPLPTTTMSKEEVERKMQSYIPGYTVGCDLMIISTPETVRRGVNGKMFKSTTSISKLIEILDYWDKGHSAWQIDPNNIHRVNYTPDMLQVYNYVKETPAVITKNPVGGTTSNHPLTRFLPGFYPGCKVRITSSRHGDKYVGKIFQTTINSDELKLVEDLWRDDSPAYSIIRLNEGIRFLPKDLEVVPEISIYNPVSATSLGVIEPIGHQSIKQKYEVLEQQKPLIITKKPKIKQLL